MKKNKIISISFSLMLMMTLILGLATTPVIATEGDVFNTFEGATVLDNFSTMNGITFDGDQTNSACAVDDDPVYAGSRSWKHKIMNNLDYYYINLSVPTKSISFWWYITDNQHCDIHMNFFNTDDELIIYLEWEDGYFYLYNHDHENYDTKIHHLVQTTDDCWNFLRITMNATDEVSFISNFDSLASWSNITDTPRYIRDNWNISYIRVEGHEGYLGNTQYMWIDNFAYNYLLGGEGGGSGQEEGSPADYSDYKRCSAGDIGNINIYAPYHDSFITTFGDSTINAVDLFVSDNQYTLVNSSKSAYVAYVNGVSIGAPDYFFQDSSDEYILRWKFLGIDVGTYDIVLEFGMTGDSGAPFVNLAWMGLPTNKYNIQGSKYDDDASDFGDGIQQGIYFYPSHTDYGIKYCLYYDLNVPVSPNSYDLTLLSVDPHLQSNTTSISVDVTGDNDWWAILRNPSDSNVFFESHFGSGNGDTVYTHTFAPDAEVGEWTFYALDRGYYSYPFGGCDDYGTNISLNVSDGSGSFENWSVFPYSEIVGFKEYTGFNVLAPVGQDFTVRVYSPYESTYEDYVGIGQGATLIPSGDFIYCDVEGWWTLMLFNTTGATTYNEDIEQFFVTGSSLQNLLSITTPTDVCVGGYITFEGKYISSIGSIEIILDADHMYSIGVGLGTFVRHFTIPQDAIGDWVAYLADTDGDIIEGTTVTFRSADCGEEPPPDDDDVDDDAGDWADAIIPDEFNPYVGAIIVGVFLCIPFGLTASTGFDFPVIGYGFFGILGLGLSTSLGFFPMWLVYLLIVTLITTAIIFFIRR